MVIELTGFDSELMKQDWIEEKHEKKIIWRDVLNSEKRE